MGGGGTVEVVRQIGRFPRRRELQHPNKLFSLELLFATRCGFSFCLFKLFSQHLHPPQTLLSQKKVADW